MQNFMQNKNMQYVLYAGIGLLSVVALSFIGPNVISGANIFVRLLMIVLGTLGVVTLTKILLIDRQKFQMIYLIPILIVIALFLFSGSVNEQLKAIGLQGFSVLAVGP